MAKMKDLMNLSDYDKGFLDGITTANDYLKENSIGNGRVYKEIDLFHKNEQERLICESRGEVYNAPTHTNENITEGGDNDEEE